MHDDHRDTICRLFSVSTILLGDMNDIAVAGQSRKLTADQYRKLVDQMLSYNDAATAIASTIVAIIELAEREASTH